MTEEEYIKLGEDGQAALLAIIKTKAPLARVLDRDPVNPDLKEWAAELKSDTDGKRIHCWIVTFAGSTDVKASQIRSIAPTFRYRVQFFHYHEFGKSAANSEKSAREESLKVQFAIARTAKLVVGTKHNEWPFRIALSEMRGVAIMHRAEGEVELEIDPINVR
jgi:hypothetical protein